MRLDAAPRVVGRCRWPWLPAEHRYGRYLGKHGRFEGRLDIRLRQSIFSEPKGKRLEQAIVA